jgi:hypothetical protein
MNLLGLYVLLLFVTESRTFHKIKEYINCIVNFPSQAKMLGLCKAIQTLARSFRKFLMFRIIQTYSDIFRLFQTYSDLSSTGNFKEWSPGNRRTLLDISTFNVCQFGPFKIIQTYSDLLSRIQIYSDLFEKSHSECRETNDSLRSEGGWRCYVELPGNVACKKNNVSF